MLVQDKFRIAVGLVAVSLKPPGQSWSAYIIDLKSRFPNPLTSDDQCSAAWRERALALEDDLKNTQMEVQKLILEVHANGNSGTTSSQETQPKSKKKRSRQEQCEKVCSQTWGNSAPSLFQSLKIIGAQKHLKGLLAKVEKNEHLRSLVLPACQQLLVAHGNLIAHCLSPAHCYRTSKENFQRFLCDVNDFFAQFLEILIINTDCSFAVEALSPQLISLVIRPLLRALVPQSKLVVFHICEDGHQSSETRDREDHRDIRFWLWGILNMIVNWPTRSQATKSLILETVLLETLQELENALENFPRITPDGLISRSMRLDRLVAKQSLWFLCSLIQLCLSKMDLKGSNGNSMTYRDDIIGSRFSDIMATILSQERWEQAWLGESEKELLLRLTEQFWLAGIINFPSNQDTVH